MTIPRKIQINLNDTLYYHCIGRCVRRAFLYGEDAFSGRTYYHRKKWVIEQLNALCSTFAISICAYAVMSNHYHLVLRVEPERLTEWSDEEVMERYKRLHQLRCGSELLAESKNKTPETPPSLEQIKQYREKLIDISTFMGALNEHLARKANKEDNCKGRFWEGRFKSMALLDDGALLACMAYVDLNPVRAGVADSLEASDFTSIQERLVHYQQEVKEVITPEKVTISETPYKQTLMKDNPGIANHLCAFINQEKSQRALLPYSWEDYHHLVDWTGRQIRGDKKGFLSPQINSLLSTLSLSQEAWVAHTKQMEKIYSWAVGSAEKLQKIVGKKSGKWIRGMKQPVSTHSIQIEKSG